jgi:hypothetical protein
MAPVRDVSGGDGAGLPDACRLRDVVGMEPPTSDAVAAHLGIVIAGDAEDVCGGFGGWQVDLKKARRGLLLSPQNMSDGELVGIRLQRGSIGQPVQPGRGLLHPGDNTVHTVQVPLTTSRSSCLGARRRPRNDPVEVQTCGDRLSPA